MSESGYYPPGAENDPNAPWNQDSGESLYKIKQDMLSAKLNEKGHSWLRESFSEATEDWCRLLADAVMQEDWTEIGQMVIKRIEDYAMPSDEDAQEEARYRNDDSDRLYDQMKDDKLTGDR